jgi:g-D-glutamyl-meso-diaminopimelate peptidase
MRFNNIIKKIENLKQKTDTKIIGYSYLHNPIYLIHIGSYNSCQILIQGGIHAREYITTFLIFKLIDKYYNKKLKYGYYFIPVSNPDGEQLVINGINSIKNQKIKQFLLKINKSNDFSEYKANIRGVDLNTNFDACYSKGKRNIFYPAPKNYVGKKCESEKETKILTKVAKTIKPKLVISYHSRGEVIYYGFVKESKNDLKRDKKIANKLSSVLKYKYETIFDAVGGFEDFMIDKFKVPSFTIEVGNDSMGKIITSKNLSYIFNQNKNIIKMIEELKL